MSESTVGIGSIPKCPCSSTPLTSIAFSLRRRRDFCHSRGDQGHLKFGEHVVLQSEVIRAILLKDSPRCGVPPPPLRRQ